VEPRRQDLVRERGARRKSTRVIYDDEQRRYRAKSCLPFGLRRRPVPALSQLLSNVPHCLRRRFALESGRRSQRGPREFHHGLLEHYTSFQVVLTRPGPRIPSGPGQAH
jgi:hypothetical protein